MTSVRKHSFIDDIEYSAWQWTSMGDESRWRGKL